MTCTTLNSGCWLENARATAESEGIKTKTPPMQRSENATSRTTEINATFLMFIPPEARNRPTCHQTDFSNARLLFLRRVLTIKFLAGFRSKLIAQLEHFLRPVPLRIGIGQERQPISPLPQRISVR